MASLSTPIIRVLTGPTAVGKTESALRWAEANDAEIVSCDSLLFYRGMDIGTAKPTAEELGRVRHHLVDIADVRERMDVKRYVQLAQKAVADILARGKQVLVTGGSGFYLKAFFGPVTDDVSVAAETRLEVQTLIDQPDGLAAAVARLRTLNPAGIGALDTDNPRRVARALERCLATGRTLADLEADFARQPGPFSPYAVRLLRLDRPRPDLVLRVQLRVEQMLRAGLVGEVERLRAVGLEENPSAAGAIGYRETLAFLRAELAETALAPLIVQNTLGLVKKQLTWFRTQLPPHDVYPAGNDLPPGF